MKSRFVAIVALFSLVVVCHWLGAQLTFGQQLQHTYFVTGSQTVQPAANSVWIKQPVVAQSVGFAHSGNCPPQQTTLPPLVCRRPIASLISSLPVTCCRLLTCCQPVTIARPQTCCQPATACQPVCEPCVVHRPLWWPF